MMPFVVKKKIKVLISYTVKHNFIHTPNYGDCIVLQLRVTLR